MHPALAAHSLTRDWWKFLVAGPVLILIVIVASGVGVQAWFLGIALVLAAVGLFAIGFVLGAARVLAHARSSRASRLSNR